MKIVLGGTAAPSHLSGVGGGHFLITLTLLAAAWCEDFGTNAVGNAIGYAMHYSRLADAVIRVYAPEGSRTVGVWEAGIALGKRIVSRCPEATDLSGRFQRRVR